MRRAAANSLKAKPKKSSTRMTARQVEVMNDKYLGGEPVFVVGKPISKIEYINALNWYSGRIERETGYEWFLEYVHKNFPQKYKAAKALNQKTYNTTMAWIARLVSRGAHLPENTFLFVCRWVQASSGLAQFRKVGTDCCCRCTYIIADRCR